MVEGKNEERTINHTEDNDQEVVQHEVESVPNVATEEEIEAKKAHLHEEERQRHKDILLFVDRNPLYYERKWGVKEDPSKGISWNFAAFFLTAYWFAYRKMYRWMFAVVGLYILLEASLFGLAIVTELSLKVNLAMSIVITIAISVLTGLYGNTLYYRHVQQKVKKIEQYSSFTSDMKPFLLARTGGVNKWAIVGVASMYIVVFGGVAMYLGATEYENTVVYDVQTSDIGIELENMYSNVQWEYKNSMNWDEDLVVFSGVNRQNNERVEITFSYITVSLDEYELSIGEIAVNDRLLSGFEVDEFMRWILGDNWMEEDLFKDKSTPATIM
ncbi:DUF2628 domain-containing protein [Priestia taiwanensis]|uniref:DUF2628 domain-containing protein n=1 Tax=Priestia taiwanensis TaxID=1347902 RepID=A0A917EPP4_9BACI|nr:DUF2628 domain-containing protein [Priestia taiwanensis]MBM7363121.1 hypothetical protein [Priestia taiwanensis]GGE67855.1 hypothetical protein GCM10007140_17410 [Priestia taiwanensis]